MPDLSPEARKALAYWPQIEYAAALRMTTADLWSTIKAAADELGLSSPGVSLQAVNELRSMASGIQATSRSLERVDPTSALDGRHIAEAPWSRPMAERGVFPMHQVRFEHTINGPNGIETAWRTSTFRGALPRTLGDLMSAIEDDADELADKYGGEHVGIGSIQVLAI